MEEYLNNLGVSLSPKALMDVFEYWLRYLLVERTKMIYKTAVFWYNIFDTNPTAKA